MKNRPTLLIVALGAALLSLPLVRAEELPAGLPADGQREMRREKMGERMAEELGLTAEQKVKMKELNQAEKAELKALRESGAPAMEAQRTKIEAIRKSYLEKRQALMTPEQREKASKMREKLGNRMEKRHGDNHEKPADKK